MDGATHIGFVRCTSYVVLFPYTVLFAAGYDPADEFLLGLDLLLTALEPLRASR